MFVRFCLLASFFLISAVAYAQNAKYVNSDRYFKVGKDRFWVRGVSGVRGIGTYGLKTGTRSLQTNGFEPHGRLGAISSFNAASATVSGKSILKASSSGNLNLSAIQSLPDVTGSGNAAIQKKKNYSIVVVTPSNFEEFYQRLREAYSSPDSRNKKIFEDRDFRIIDQVVYALNMKLESGVNVSAQSDVTGAVVGINLSAKVQGSEDSQNTFVLDGKQVIAYSFRRLCWMNGRIGSATIDRPRRSDGLGCKNF